MPKGQGDRRGGRAASRASAARYYEASVERLRRIQVESERYGAGDWKGLFTKLETAMREAFAQPLVMADPIARQHLVNIVSAPGLDVLCFELGGLAKRLSNVVDSGSSTPSAGSHDHGGSASKKAATPPKGRMHLRL